MDAAWEFLDGARGATEVDAAEWTVSVVERGEIADLLARTRPAIEGYDALQRELARLRRLERAGGWSAVPAGPTLRPGDRDPRVLALRARLSAGGELAGGGEGTDAAVYDDVLVEGQSLGAISLSADRMVIWTRSLGGEQFQPQIEQQRDEPFTVYLEGNIVMRQGNQRVIRASQAIYDGREERVLLQNAELKAFVPEIQANVRVRAERLRGHLAQGSFHGQNAWTSTSQFGKPGYRVQATDVFLEERPTAPWIGPGFSIDDPEAGPPPETTSDRCPRRTNSPATSSVPRSTPPLSSAGTSCITVRGERGIGDSLVR